TPRPSSVQDRGSWKRRITPDLATFVAAQTSIYLATGYADDLTKCGQSPKTKVSRDGREYSLFGRLSSAPRASATCTISRVPCETREVAAKPGHGKVDKCTDFWHREPPVRRNQMYGNRRTFVACQHNFELSFAHLLSNLIREQTRDAAPVDGRGH